MLKFKKIYFAVPILILMSFVIHKPAYQIFDKTGKKVKYSKMIQALNKAEIVFIGEHHNNPISHWLELEVTKDLSKNSDLVLGAEMFEADNQLILTEYQDSLISDKKFEEEMRMWKNYKTDYKPLVEFANKKGFKFIATNVPRRYANLVYRKGFEGLNDLSPEAKTYLAPLPIPYDTTVNCYAEMLENPMESSHFNPNIAKAQALKDATMANFILKNLDDKKIFIHYNGSYHSDNHEGIIWYIKRKKPNIRILTLSTTEQDTITKLNEESHKIADFIIAVSSSMTKTY